jgi:hypothetical protein
MMFVFTGYFLMMLFVVVVMFPISLFYLHILITCSYILMYHFDTNISENNN